MNEKFTSVGIDIGTTTTQLVFSEITIENIAKGASVPRIKIVDKKVIYLSKIHRTPLLREDEIDGQTIKKIVIEEYLEAGIELSQVTTGVIIITGETARKKNANNVAKMLSDFAGDFVVATAGPDLESILAGKGSGADKVSKDRQNITANFDIGGGTTNISIFDKGEISDTISFDIGGSLIRFDNDSYITYIAPKVEKLAKGLNIKIKVGDRRDHSKIEKICREMALSLLKVVESEKHSKISELMVINDKTIGEYDVGAITFSGGVADYIYSLSNDLYKHKDIGVVLGKTIAKMCEQENIVLMLPLETIRATVIGAGAHTTEISGSTITITGDNLPIKNLPILKLSPKDELLTGGELENVIREKVSWFNLNEENQQVALALKGAKNTSFKDIQKLASSINKGMLEVSKREKKLVVVVENDMAKVLGQSLYKECKNAADVICIDGIRVENGDYIDIGRTLANGRVVPVVIKTLVFNF
ncbi:MAG: ethanolamine ammonia-lyase reactivating factor EutA [Alkaliphilus sp.]|nr:ethanolamine ammonia-lyase reactivating factor EutA [bacterium AH-315-L21]MBN4056521.1 ethanolamine ammonia-lyase reactivating factor EutA [bacterium AH-315-K05]PHS34809.1 MAG: ethanolamine ammonia-lyase reactivating factor EutA [Alkaliphilus sp.]